MYNIDQAGPGVIALGDVQGLPTFLIKKREIAKSWKFCKAAHENLELLVDFYVDSSSLWLVYEYEHLAVSLGCVAGIVDFSEADVATVCRETLRGLAVIHSELGISHGSVNCSNILLNWKGEIKLGRRNYPLLLGLAHDLSANVGDSMLRGRTSSASKADVEGVGSIAISLSDSTTLISGESPAESTLSDLVRNFIKTSKEKPAKELLNTRHLAFESDAILGSRPLDDANIKRLLNVFKLEGCASLDPEHGVVATISEETLQRAFEQTGIAQANLFDYGSAPNLEFADTVRLVCAYGKHRIRAGEAFGEDRWLVELYLSDIPSDALAQLREESSYAQDFKDGEIYQILRRYHLLGNTAQEQKWWARFSTEDRRKQFGRLQQNRLLCEGFDNLLHYIGLWDPLKAYHIEWILGLRCHEYIFHYLSEIHNTWSYLFPDDTGYMVDPSSVRLVEGLRPSYSSEDSNTIM
ncbi:hypothetical protein AtubIFM57258_011133 [Aspergillus tubingensis]|nr:hypothetical protein AtubIFM57258_011133 [Aspergillus tubingensis]